MTALLRMLACWAATGLLFSASWRPASAADLDHAQVEQAIHDYLLKNPEVIRDAIIELQRRETAAQEKAISAAIESNRTVLVGSPHQAVMGTGDITIVEFFDYNCPYCRKTADDVATVLNDDHKVRVALKEWPILGPDSVAAAQVSIAARMQDGGPRFQAFHEKLLAIHGHANKAVAMEVAGAAGYDLQKIEKDLNADEVKTTITEANSLARSLNINGTPTFVIGRQTLVGAVGIGALKQAIGKARQECKAQLC